MTDAKRRKATSGNSYAQSSKRIFTITPLAAAVVAALSPALPALAQEEAARLDEVIVTSTKREINLQDVPHNIDVLSQDDLYKMSASSMDDIVKALPSVSLTSTMPGRHSLVIRGISSGAYEYRTDAQVAVYLDEQPMTTNSQQVGVRIIDMNRIEQLAGPQGTLFGSSSQTGTIRYITNKPDPKSISGEIEGRYGNTSGGEDSYDISGHLNLPLVTDTLAVRVVGYSAREGGYVDNVFGASYSGNYDNAAVVEDDFNDFDVDGGRISVLWNMGENWSALFGYVFEDTAATGSWETDPFLGDHKITTFIKEFRDDDWYSASVTLKGDLGFADLSLTATQFDRDMAYEWDNMAYSQEKDYYRTYPLYNTDYYQSTTFNDQHQERDTFELRLTSTADSRLRWIVGGYYEDVYDEWYYGAEYPGYVNTTSFYAANYTYAYLWGQLGYDYACGCYFPPNPNVSYPLAATDIEYSNTFQRSVEQIALFGEVSYDLTDKLTVLGGIRWAEYDRNVYSRFAFPEGLVPYEDRIAGDGSFRDIGKSDDTIYKLSLSYEIDDDKMIYGLFSQGFRLGGVNSLRAASTGQLELVYNPDYLDNYEIGIKSMWLDSRLRLNADIFYMKWSDYQQGVSFDEWWLRGTVNAKEAETKGFEVKLDWYITDNFSISANLFSASPEFTADWENNFVDGILDIRAGMPMPNSPEEKASVSLYYSVPDVLGGELWFYYDYFYQSETWAGTWEIVNNDLNGLAPSWTSSNFSVGMEFPSDLSVVIDVKNIFDDTGYGWVETGDNDKSDLFGDPRFYNRRSLPRPRTVWLKLRKGFGS